MPWRDEFPADYDAPALPAGWEDVSWRNEQCPQYETPKGLEVWMDHPVDAQREFPSGDGGDGWRFHVTLPDGDERHILMATDSWPIVRLFVGAFERRMK